MLRRGKALLDRLQHGRIVLDQPVAALLPLDQLQEAVVQPGKAGTMANGNDCRIRKAIPDEAIDDRFRRRTSSGNPNSRLN